ncbi:MAG: ATP-binding protein, partial [Pseudomonadota bacterium]
YRAVRTLGRRTRAQAASSSSGKKIYEDVVELNSSLAKSKGLQLNLEWNTNLPKSIKTDATRVKQVLNNLISNAIKFSGDRSTISVSMEVTGNTDKEILLVKVCDEGPGVPEDELGSIFDKFVQSSVTRSGAGGTGLGLAISKEIVDLHGGKIRAFNNAESGVTFEFWVPVSAES